MKVMRPGVVSSALLKRFDYEAEILGRLTHPGIAHIYSVGSQEVAGVTVPYFVMEFIPNAKSLTEYAKAHELSTHDRMKLFREVCDAAAHGHHKGIIHRDLKPSNILVNTNGQPKVIDFGIARSTDADVAMTTLHTDAGKIIGTLQYMCPEQFNADANDIDVRADIYALGVVLWQLITDEFPYDIASKPVFEAARIVKESDPIWPVQYTHPRYRDIKLIALQCLEKDRDRRYSHASDLVDEIDRYLRGDALLASPPSLLDSLWRLARKHRIAAAAIAGVFAAMVLAIVGITSFYVQADRERVWAEKQRRKAQLQEAEAIGQRQDSDKVLQFLVKTFQLPASQPTGRDMTLRELLPMARSELDKQYGKSPTGRNALVKADILKALGTSLLGLGSPLEAKMCLAESLQLIEFASTGDTPDKALCMNELGVAQQACGEYFEAQDTLRSALSIKELKFGTSHIETALGRANLAITLSSLGSQEAAISLLEQSLKLFERNLGPSDPAIATTLEQLGKVRYRKGEYTEAESLLTAASTIRQRVVGRDHIVNSAFLGALGDVYRSTGRYEEAAAAYSQVQALQERFHGKSSPQIASTLSRRGELHRIQGEFTLAKPLLEEALAIQEGSGFASHPDTAVIMHRLALLDAAEGMATEAEGLFLRVIALRETRLGHSHPDTVSAVRDLARFYRETGNTESANAMEQRVGYTMVDGT